MTAIVVSSQQSHFGYAFKLVGTLRELDEKFTEVRSWARGRVEQGLIIYKTDGLYQQAFHFLDKSDATYFKLANR